MSTLPGATTFESGDTNPIAPSANTQIKLFVKSSAFPATIANSTAYLEDSTGTTGPLVNGVSSVSNADGTLTISPTTGAIVASRPAITGDVTIAGGSNVSVLANIPNATPAAGDILFTNVAAPSTPAAGKTFQYVDSTSKNMASKNDAGTVNHGIQTRTATASNWIRSIADDGSSTISQPAVGDISGFGTGVATWLGTPSSANLIAALTDETGTGSAVFANAGTLKPKDISGRVFVDPSNTQGWSGADAGAWINSAFSYIHSTYTDTNGGIIELAPGSYSFSTPIVLANAGLMSIILRGAGDGNGATILNYTATSGACISFGGGSGNDGGVQLENFTLTGTAQGNGATAIQIGVVGTAGTAGSTIKNVSIRRFTTGMLWATTNIAYAVTWINCKIQQCTTAVAPFGEDNTFFGGLIGGNASGIVPAGASCECNLFGVAFDDNTTTAINLSNANQRFTLDGCRFENAGLGTSNYITISGGTITMHGGAFQEDNTTSTAAGFVTSTGGILTSTGVWHYTGGRTMTQCYNVSSTGVVNLVGPLVSPASAVSGITTWITPGAGAALGRMFAYVPPNAIGASLANINTTETVLVNIPVPFAGVRVGSQFRATVTGTFTNTTAVTTNTITIRAGTAGTTGDASIATLAYTGSATAGTAVPFRMWIDFTVTTVGASGAIQGTVTTFVNALGLVAALNTTNLNTALTATTTYNTLTSTFIDITAKTSAATSNFVAITEAYLEQVRF